MEKVNSAIQKEEELICIGYNLPKIDISGKKFRAPVYFNYAVFHESAVFSETEFISADFRECKFSDAEFSGAKFTEVVNFNKTEFSVADFSKAEFSEFSEAYFNETKFNTADFIEAKFYKANFSKAEFSKAEFTNVEFFRANFNEAKFFIADFRGAKFTDMALFARAEFSFANFAASKFSRFVSFIEAEFFVAAFFEGCKFPEANFAGTKFSNVNFIGSEFSKAIFTRAELSKADFSGVKFSKAYFNGTKFLGRTVFNLYTFSKSADFKKAIFSPDMLEKCLDPGNLISFRRVTFSEPENVVFDGCDMRRVSFIHTNIERVKFRNVEWGDFRIYDDRLFALKLSEKERKKFIEEGAKKLRKVLNDEPDSKIKKLVLKIVEKIRSSEGKVELNSELIGKPREEKLEEIREYVEKDEDLTEDNILSVYRDLRENYDYHLKYEVSGRFFVNEMELKKRSAGRVEKIVLEFYKWLCHYGESYECALFWMGLTILIFFALRVVSNLDLFFTEQDPFLIFIALIEYFLISIATFFQLNPDSSLLTVAERLISIPILGSLYISLRRKLERRVRH